MSGSRRSNFPLSTRICNALNWAVEYNSAIITTETAQDSGTIASDVSVSGTDMGCGHMPSQVAFGGLEFETSVTDATDSAAIADTSSASKSS